MNKTVLKHRVLLSLFLFLSCNNETELTTFFNEFKDNVENKILLEEYSQMPLEKAIHGGPPEIFVTAYNKTLENKEIEQSLKNYLINNNIDTMSYYTFCIINAHFHMYLNEKEIKLDEIKEFVRKHQYDY